MIVRAGKYAFIFRQSLSTILLTINLKNMHLGEIGRSLYWLE